jgi:GntR family transcriptional regulator, transcriptional repressor for pyruvate dehydrogenase complex
MLARKLQEAILGGEFDVGSPLGSERFLMAKFDCGRATVREALRVLRGQDLIEVRRGRNGGWFVCKPSQDRVVNSLDRLISGQNFRLIDLIFAREAIETASAVQAAQFPDEEKLSELRQANEVCENSINDLAAFVDANLEWHLALARASNNPLFVAFLTSISKAMHIATELEEFDLPTRRTVVGIHWQIYAAIRGGDAEAARRRTQRHLDAYRNTLATLGAEPERAA